MAPLHGIQVYEILENGNLLNSIYTNSRPLKEDKYVIENEIARKKKHDDNGVIGHYDCRYIETNNSSVTDCDLEIKKYGEAYEFIWSNGKPIWTGIGLKVGDRHIAVSYIKAT